MIYSGLFLILVRMDQVFGLAFLFSTFFPLISTLSILFLCKPLCNAFVSRDGAPRCLLLISVKLKSRLLYIHLEDPARHATCTL